MKQTHKAIGLSLICAFALSACADGERVSKTNTNKGIGLGAAAGALAGLVIGDDKKGVILGAAAGAAIGGIIGHKLDEQEAALRESMTSQDATITNTGSELIVTLPEGITFDSNSNYVNDGFRPEIYKIANNLRQYPDTTVDVIGHTDSSGSDEYNQTLSSDRAYAVSEILTGQGVNTDRLLSYGRGETTPIASNDTEHGKAKNRRVEIVIRPAA